LPFKKIYDTDIDSIADASYICDTEMTILYVNSAFELLTGLKCDKIVNKKCYYVFNNSQNTCKNICTSTNRKNEGNYFAYHDSQIFTPSKELKDVRFLIFPRYEKERLAGYLVIIKEQSASKTGGAALYKNQKTPNAPASETKIGTGLTDKKLMIIANELLKENELLKKKLLSGQEIEPGPIHSGALDVISLDAPCGIFTVDQTRRITGWNLDAERISGYSADEMFGQKCDCFMQSPCVRKCLMFSEDKKAIHGEECTLKTKDGRLLTVLRSLEIMTAPDGKVSGGIETFEDITSRKLGELELSQSREAAEKALRDKNFLIEKLAREMTFPIHTVTDFSTMLEKSNLSEREKDILAHIKTNCEVLSNLINTLLDISKK